MQSVLIDEWLGDGERLLVGDEASVSLVRESVRAMGARVGLGDVATARLVNVASELAHNQLAYAIEGAITIAPVEREGVAGIEVIAADRGPGIADPTRALRGGPRDPDASDQKTSLGIGLSAAVELSDEIDFDVRIDEGTCIRARKFAHPVTRRRQVGIYGRPCPGEVVSGDHAAFVRGTDSLLVALADGLGHGQPARDASDVAMDTLRHTHTLALDALLARCHQALRGTRGAVMAVGRIVEPGELVQAACAGNISVHLYGLQASRRLAAPSFVLGSPGEMRKPALEENSFGIRDVLVLFSDGLVTRTDLEGERDLLREHPIVIAHQLVERFGRDTDDALVLVVR